MTGLRERAVQMLGVLCLLGQGTLIFVGSRGQLEPGLAWPGLFLFLTVALVLVLAWGVRRLLRLSEGHQPMGVILTGGLLLLTVGVLLASGLGDVLEQGTVPQSGTSPTAGPNTAVVTARSDLESFPAALENLLPWIRQEDQNNEAGLTRGGLFRSIQNWPAIWPRFFAGAEALPVQAVLHRSGQIVAWTDGAEPLTFHALEDNPELDDLSYRLVITKLKNHWFLLAETRWRDGLQLELQFPLKREIYASRWPGVLLQVTTGDQVPVIVDGRNMFDPETMKAAGFTYRCVGRP